VIDATAVLADGSVIPRIIVGGWQLSAGHRRSSPSRDAVIDELVQVVADGLTTFDCADIYTGVESVFGELRRVCAARLGQDAARLLRFHTKLVPDRAELAHVDRRYVERIVDRSLKRLDTERLDLIQFAWWDYDVPGYLEAIGWLDELRRAGKVGAIGVTNFDVPRLREILDTGVPVTTSQVQYSALDHRPENGMVSLCREHGIGLLCYGTLAGGFLSDRWLGAPDPGHDLANRSLVKYRLIIDDYGGWVQYQKVLAALRTAADATGSSIARTALAYVLGRPGVAAAIVGMSRPGRLREAVSSMDVTVPSIHVEGVRRRAASASGPRGDCFELERIKDGPHAAIMKYDLNREADA
jgi:aryl-alcohol dehydrogenase-like predicted oxidoreductase